MHEIALGDPVAGYTVIHGTAMSVPNFKATLNFKFSPELFVAENIDIQVKGTPAQVQSFLAALETIIYRSILYENVAYQSPQYLRVQLAPGGAYYYTPLSNMYLAANPAGYLTQQGGNKQIILHYTRPNHFDGPQAELPLSGRAGSDVTGGYQLKNLTDSGAGNGSTVLVKKTDIDTIMPAPLRFEFYFESAGAANVKDFFVGAYAHPTYDSDAPFFAYYNDLSGGTSYADAGAVQGNYRRWSYTSSAWSLLGHYLIDTAFINYFNGSSYRPILHLFNTHAYSDLYLRVQLERFGEILYISEPVHAPPGYGYVILPPVELPPNYLLREVAPARIQVSLYSWRISGATTTLDVDCLTLFPISHAATFYGFRNLVFEEKFVDDSFRERYNMRTSASAGETTGHARVGGPLLLHPHVNNRLFFYMANASNLMPIAYTGKLQVFYRPRLRLL